MTSETIYILAGVLLAALAMHRLCTARDALARILALNVLSVGIAMLMLLAGRVAGVTDAVPQAFVLTGIVVLVAVTAALLSLAERISGGDDD
ncbi:hypothetical protein G5B39_13840 (plasmid) [Rhodobacteraceae bacterium SC52]|nr:hypothetical protein G5B39_13840 [Rhodobacteraceae bacterium SC52]